MDKSLSKDYPKFTYNNETVIIKPGNQFHSNELRSRLHQMDIDAREIQGKSQLANLYNSTIQDDHNKFKLLDRLRNDTSIYATKMGISLNKKMPMSTNIEMINPERSKVINLKYASNLETPYDENNYEENNSRIQDIKLKRPRQKKIIKVLILEMLFSLMKKINKMMIILIPKKKIIILIIIIITKKIIKILEISIILI